jgi:hypothetical protein
MYQLAGANGFTTLSVERANNATVTAGVWQTTTLSATTVVWQTNQTDAFCDVNTSFCTYAEFKEHYPAAHFVGFQQVGGVATSRKAAVDLVGHRKDAIADQVRLAPRLRRV